jgi:hypothetical protein
MRRLVAFAGTVALVSFAVLCGPFLQSRVEALAGCCVCKDCPGEDTCDEQQTGDAQCEDLCEQQGCERESAIFVGGAPNNCANGCNGNFGGSDVTPLPTNTPTRSPTITSTPSPTHTLTLLEVSEKSAPAIAPQPLLVLTLLLAVSGFAILVRQRRRSKL